MGYCFSGTYATRETARATGFAPANVRLLPLLSSHHRPLRLLKRLVHRLEHLALVAELDGLRSLPAAGLAAGHGEPTPLSLPARCGQRLFTPPAVNRPLSNAHLPRKLWAERLHARTCEQAASPSACSRRRSPRPPPTPRPPSHQGLPLLLPLTPPLPRPHPAACCSMRAAAATTRWPSGSATRCSVSSPWRTCCLRSRRRATHAAPARRPVNGVSSHLRPWAGARQAALPRGGADPEEPVAVREGQGEPAESTRCCVRGTGPPSANGTTGQEIRLPELALCRPFEVSATLPEMRKAACSLKDQASLTDQRAPQLRISR